MNNETLVREINALRKEKDAVILAHNYQPPEIQEIADHLGDSLALSFKARDAKQKVIVFCGVHFMAETASILSPDKTVLLPDPAAGCSMADMIDADTLLDLKEKYPDALVVSYINSTAAVKAESDICCTSSNAKEVVESLPADKKIIFVPDKYLGGWVAKETGRDLILHEGWCAVHMEVKEMGLQAVKKANPNALVLAHPECPVEVSEAADRVLSTGQMVQFCNESDVKEFIIATETGIIHQLRRDNPGKAFYAANEEAVCPTMKLTTLEKVRDCLRDMKPEINVADSIREDALRPIKRMMDLKLKPKVSYVGCQC